MTALGFAMLVAAGALAYLLRRHEEVLKLQAQVFHARFALEALLRHRRELAEVWCSLCEDRETLPDHVRLVRRSLARIARAAAEKEPAGAPVSAARLADEKHLGQLIRDGYALFLAQFADEGPHKDFFRQYFRSLTRLEKEIGDAEELYNDSVRVYNGGLTGWTGWIFRRWEKLAPRAALSAADAPPRPRRWSPSQAAPAAAAPAADAPVPFPSRHSS